jgi:hypothetical protein
MPLCDIVHLPDDDFEFADACFVNFVVVVDESYDVESPKVCDGGGVFGLADGVVGDLVVAGEGAI